MKIIFGTLTAIGVVAALGLWITSIWIEPQELSTKLEETGSVVMVTAFFSGSIWFCIALVDD